MRFNLVCIESKDHHCGHFLDDGLRAIRCGLESLGHDVSTQLNKLATDRTNVILAPWINRHEDIQTIASAGPYIAIQSEVLTDSGLNSWNNRESVDQFYIPFLAGATAVWDAKPTCLARLRQMGLRAFQLPFGYHPRLEDIDHSRDKDIDFSFLGRRRHIENLGSKRCSGWAIESTSCLATESSSATAPSRERKSISLRGKMPT